MLHTPGVPIQDILFTVFQSIFQVFLLCLSGFMLSFRGIVDKPTSKALNHINIALFTPALLFSKVAYFLSPGKLRQLWVIPIFFVVLTTLSALVAHWLARACRLKRSQVNFATAAAMFMNSNSLPVALMQSLTTTVPLLKWGEDDTFDAMFGRSLTYLVVFSTLGMILRWSYGVRILQLANEPDSPSPPASTTYRDSEHADQHPVLAHIAVDPLPTAHLVDYEAEIDVRKWRTRTIHTRPTPLAQRHSHPNHKLHSHLPAVPTSLGDQSESEDTDEFDTTEGESEDTIAFQSETTHTGFSMDTEGSTSVPHVSSSNVHSTARWGQPDRPPFLKQLFTFVTSLSPPLVASLSALFCVLIPPAQRLLNSNEMIPLKGALNAAGECSVPLTLIVLGGWFWDGDNKTKNNKPSLMSGECGVRGRPGGQDKTKSKGKGVPKLRHENGVGPTPVGKQSNQDLLTPVNDSPALHLKRQHTSPSRESSSGSLSSLISAFGDVFLARLHPRSNTRQAARGIFGPVPASQSDMEPGLLMSHTETGHEDVENGSHPSRSRSRSGSQADPASGGSPIPLSTRETTPSGETLTVIVTLLSRMVIVPLIIAPLLVLVSRFGLGGEVLEDPVFIISSLLLTTSPPALTLAQISQRAKVAAGTGTRADSYSPFESLFSRTVFWSYCFLTPPVTIVSVMVGLLLIEG